MNKFCIIIPFYRELTELDKFSVSRLFTVCKDKNYPIWFIEGEGKQYAEHTLDWLVETGLVDNDCLPSIYKYSKYYFESVNSYSNLLLELEFYQHWNDLGYNFIFIYQTDCYLFKDEFKEWVNKGYDYIGAPIVATNSDWGYNGPYVGNGGFSLRNTNTFIRVLDRNSTHWKDHKRELECTVCEKHRDKLCMEFEDLFICKLLSKYIYIDIPTPVIASRFCIDRNPDTCYKMFKFKRDETPMCCHNFMLNVGWWIHYMSGLNPGDELTEACNTYIHNFNNMVHPELEGRQA